MNNYLIIPENLNMMIVMRHFRIGVATIHGLNLLWKGHQDFDLTMTQMWRTKFSIVYRRKKSTQHSETDLFYEIALFLFGGPHDFRGRYIHACTHCQR